MKSFSHLVIFIIAVLCLYFCVYQHRQLDNSGKGRSVSKAIGIIAKHADRTVFAEISRLDDVDALRIIAVATQAASWPVEAGESLDVDSRLNEMSFAAIARLHRIGTDEARESLDYAKQIFVIDGATGTFFKELEFGPITDEIVEEQMRHVNKTEPSVLP